jgi:hypothetical protein
MKRIVCQFTYSTALAVAVVLLASTRTKNLSRYRLFLRGSSKRNKAVPVLPGSGLILLTTLSRGCPLSTEKKEQQIMEILA